MGRGKQRNMDDEFTRVEAKADRRDRRQADADEKMARAPKSRGLRSQGDVGIVQADRPLMDNPRGRRAEPTRFDAMPIAGHERLAGYHTPVTTRDENMHYPGPELNRASISSETGAGPDAMKIDADQVHDLQHSSEDAVTEAVQEASEEAVDDAAFDEHVASTDLAPRSRPEDDEDKDF